MKALSKTSLKRTLISLLVIGVLTFSEAKDIVGNKDDNPCKEADASDSDVCLMCSLDKVSADDLMLSDAARGFFGKEENRKDKKHTLSQLQVFHCQCVKTSVCF